MNMGMTLAQQLYSPPMARIKPQTHRLPYVDRLIEQLGGQDWLSSMINASKFEYKYSKDVYEEDYVLGGYNLSSITTLSYAIEVEFMLGWEKKWVCNIKHNVDEYLIVLRQCPLTRLSHDTHRTFCYSANYVKVWLESHTGLALSF